MCSCTVEWTSSLIKWVHTPFSQDGGEENKKIMYVKCQVQNLSKGQSMTDSVLILPFEVHLTLKKGGKSERLQVLSFLFSFFITPSPFFGFRPREQFDPLEVSDAQIYTPTLISLLEESGLHGILRSIMLNVKCPNIKLISAFAPQPQQTCTTPQLENSIFLSHFFFFLLMETPCSRL